MPSGSEISERESVKLRRLFFSRKKKREEKKEKTTPDEKRKFIVMKMTWDQALDVIKQIEEQEKDDSEVLQKNVKMRNF